MINSTKQLNEIVRNLSKKNAINSVSQLVSIINLCTKNGIRFSEEINYNEESAAFTSNNFPEWNAEIINHEIELLANQHKYEEAAVKRDEMISIKTEIHRRFRLEKHGTEDWFINKSEIEILFLPTEIAVIDNLIQEKINEE